MDVNDECRKLIAKYLKENGFPKTLAAFEAEAPKPSSSSAGLFDSVSLPDVVDLLLQQQDLARELSATTLNESAELAKPFDWHVGITSPLPQSVTRTLRDIHLSSILSVTFTHLPQRIFDTTTAAYVSKAIPCIATSSTDKRIVFTSTETWEVVDSYEPTSSATLVTKFNPIYPYLMLNGSMNGVATVTNLLTREDTSFRNHTKYVVRVAWSDDGLWFATLSYDKTVCLYEVVPSQENEAANDDIDTDEYAHTPTFTYHLRWQKTLPTNPEACIFTPDSKYLIFSRRDDNHLYYVQLPQHSTVQDPGYKEADIAVTLLNLNENEDAHISFSILSIALHPSKQALTLQTDTDISRIIIVPLHSNQRLRHPLYTGAEQSAYSNPRHAWLEDGSGVVVSSEDGIIRIVDLNGKVKVSMGAHGIAAPQDQEPVPVVGEALRARYQADRGSSVVRDVCVIPGNRIVSVGLDKTVRVAEVQ